MAHEPARLPNAGFAALILEAVRKLNPEDGLTQDELADYVFSKLQLCKASIQKKVDQFLTDATDYGAMVRTEEDRYQLVDQEGALQAALDASWKKSGRKMAKRGMNKYSHQIKKKRVRKATKSEPEESLNSE